MVALRATIVQEKVTAMRALASMREALTLSISRTERLWEGDGNLLPSLVNTFTALLDETRRALGTADVKKGGGT